MLHIVVYFDLRLIASRLCSAAQPQKDGGGMAYYRLYFLDHSDRIADAADIDCVTDERAIAAARGQATGHKIEVWQRDRKVGLFEGPGD